MFAGKKSAQIREILISESAWEEMTCLFAPSLGNGLAIPHGTDGSDCEIIKSGISLVQFPDGIDFGDGNTAYITIGIAGKEGEHMDLLNKIALICIEEKNVQALRTANSIEYILQVLNI
nr:PTS sugar transporter subunit IIA [Citrobacter sp. Res13-Lact-LER2-35-b]